MATAQGKQHDYHLVDPSPWPAVGSLSAFIMAVGAIAWMHHMFSAAPIVFGVGTVGVLYTMASWWADVIKEAQYKGDHTRVVQLHHRYGMILFIASEVMFFVAWFWAYFNAALFPADAVHATRDAVFGCGLGTQAGACAVPGTWPPRASRPSIPGTCRSEHAYPADVGHHGDLGAPCAARERSSGPQIRPDPHRRARRALHLRAGL